MTSDENETCVLSGSGLDWSELGGSGSGDRNHDGRLAFARPRFCDRPNRPHCATCWHSLPVRWAFRFWRRRDLKDARRYRKKTSVALRSIAKNDDDCVKKQSLRYRNCLQRVGDSRATSLNSAFPAIPTAGLVRDHQTKKQEEQ